MSADKKAHQCTIGPSALISISDHLTRLEFTQSEKEKIALGGLVGEYIRDKQGNITSVKILDSIEGTYENGQLDAEKMATMIGLTQTNYKTYELVGYYNASKGADIKNPKGFKWPLTKENPASKFEDAEAKETHFPTIYLVWDAAAKGTKGDLGIRMFSLDKKGQIKKNKVPYGIEQRDAEVIALNDVLTLESNRTSLTKLQRYREGVSNLMSRADILLEYLTDVAESKKTADSSVLRGINSLLSRLPLTGGKAEFEDALLDEYAMSQLYAYLGAMTEGSAMLANNNIAVSKASSRSGYSGNRMFGF